VEGSSSLKSSARSGAEKSFKNSKGLGLASATALRSISSPFSFPYAAYRIFRASSIPPETFARVFMPEKLNSPASSPLNSRNTSSASSGAMLLTPAISFEILAI
jgi:hypothetical protein